MALRYLKGAEGRAEGRSFLRFITFVAVGGIALGVAALLLSFAIVRGFSQEIQSKLVGVGSHVQVSSYLEDAPLDDADRLEGQLAALDSVTHVMPVVEDFVLLRRSSASIDGVALVGTPRAPQYLSERISDGRFALTADTSARAASGRAPANGLVVGKQLARRLDLAVGDRVTAFSMRSGERGMAVGRPRVTSFTITGIYETSLTNVDDVYVFTHVDAARDLTGVQPNQVSRFDLTLQDVSAADSVADAIEEKFGFPIAARTIYEQYAGLFAWVNLQESIIPLVIGVIVLVAAFNIIGTLLMLILEKTREIGVLQSLGASGQTLKRLFLMLGLLIGVAGTAIGEGLALGLGLLQKKFEIIPLPAEAYYMTTAPVELNALDFVLVAAVTLALCALAAYVPARIAARIEPVRAIRFE
jgi:lipoprotein-releasing system permease protein